MEFMAAFGFGCFLGLLGRLLWVLSGFILAKRKPAQQRVKGSTAIVYCVARFACGCFLTNGILTTCQAHRVMESIDI